MTRGELLDYIKTTHGDALGQVGLAAVDTPESLSYSISDALLQVEDSDQKAEADRRVANLIRDRAAAVDIEPQPDPIQDEGITDVSNL